MMIEIKKHKFNIFPEMQEEDFGRLKQDLVANGYDVKNPIWIYQDAILDGWNRSRACSELGIIPVYRDFNGSDTEAIEFVMRTNKRRNLNSSQWACIATEADDLIATIKESVEKERRERQAETQRLADERRKEVEANKLVADDEELIEKEERSTPMQQLIVTQPPIVAQPEKNRNVTDTKIAATFNTNRTYINEAQRLKRDNPVMFEKVKAGEKTITEAKKEEKKEIVAIKEAEYKAEIKEISSFDVDIFSTDKKFNIIYADPAWKYWDGGDKNQSLHYKTMTVDEICNLPVKGIADENCILLLWVTFPILQESFKVIESWGFKYSTCGFTWVKKNKNADSWFFGNGVWTRANSELCLIATKGSMTRLSASISQILDDRIMEHSRKPSRVRGLITELVGELPRIELFSRNEDQDGWFNWGNKI